MTEETGVPTHVRPQQIHDTKSVTLMVTF